MKRLFIGLAAMAALSACSGGNPFVEETNVDPNAGIPEALTNNLQGITYDPVAQTLVVRGIALDNTPIDAVYTRKPALDRAGYEAYTVQDSSLDRHTTVYVRDIDGTRATVAVGGVQFETYFSGTVYARNGAYDPPATTAGNGLVSYAGGYVGMLNGPGVENDLLPVTPGTPDDVRPRQSAVVTGNTFVNADFAQNVVNGTVYDRVAALRSGNLTLNTIALEPSAIDPTTGAFTGNVTQNLDVKGTYGGIFGGTDASVVAGSLFFEDHIDGVENEEEYGMFVLSACNTPNAAPICTQPNP